MSVRWVSTSFVSGPLTQHLCFLQENMHIHYHDDGGANGLRESAFAVELLQPLDNVEF
jgi:hypothetical protein